VVSFDTLRIQQNSVFNLGYSRIALAICHSCFGWKCVLVAKENLGKLWQISQIIVHFDEILEMEIWLMKFLTSPSPWLLDLQNSLNQFPLCILFTCGFDLFQ
jgi:hypothetical protein